MRSWAVALMVVLGGWPAAAHGQTSAPASSVAALSWLRGAGAEACPGLRELAARIDAQLGRQAIVSPGAAAIFIEAEIVPAAAGPGWRVHIGLTVGDAGVSGVREISSPSP